MRTCDGLVFMCTWVFRVCGCVVHVACGCVVHVYYVGVCVVCNELITVV